VKKPEIPVLYTGMNGLSLMNLGNTTDRSMMGGAMGLKNVIALTIVFSFLLFEIAYAKPSKPIAQAMNTPASVFDMFLFSIYSQLGCSACRQEEEYCIETIHYDIHENLIKIEFRIENPSDRIKKADEKQRKNFMITYLHLCANRLGLKSKITLVGTTRYGWGTKSFNELKFREEVAKRTVISIRASVGTILYTATQDHLGKVYYHRNERSNNRSSSRGGNTK
jgi:hypothetical protein